MIRRVAAVFAFLVVASGWLLAQDSPLPGPAGGVAGLPTTGGTMTGQVVFSGVTTDISTGTNEDMTIAPAGTGAVVVASTGGSSTSETFFTWHVSDATTTKYFLRVYNGTTANGDLIPVIVGATNATIAAAAGVATIGLVNDGTDIATNDAIIQVSAYETTDGFTGTWSVPENRALFGVKGGGSTKLNVGVNGELRQVGYSTTLGTCTSANVAEQKFYSKTAANKISHCVCVMTAAATYAWETTHASGDCT